MLTICVAEDQLLIQKDICKKIEKTGADAKVICTAINGQDAYSKIISLNPDLLITDIRMPVLDGLALIRKLKEDGLPTYTVILSGYRDFDYAKEALKLGVDDYILKPVSTEDIQFVLNSIEEKKSARHDKTLLDILKSLIHSKTPATPDYASSFQYSYYYLFMLNLDSFYTLSIRGSLPYEEELDKLFSGPVIRKYLRRSERHYILDGNNCNEKLILFCLHHQTEEKLVMLARELIKGAENFTQAATICMSSRMNDISSLGMNCQLLQIQIKNQLLYAHSSLLFGKSFLNTKQSSKYLLDQEMLDRFRFHINSQNPDTFFQILKEFLLRCEAEKTTQKNLESYLKKILEISFPALENDKMVNLYLELEEYISNSRTYEELFTSLSFLFEQVYEKSVLNTQNLAAPEKLVEEIQQYIQLNFSQEININDIAGHFSITPAYLSRLFKKYSNTKPIEYLMNCRINLACKYFQESALSVREVAELCGYANQYYFSKVFKQVTSYSPSEYRIRYQKE